MKYRKDEDNRYRVNFMRATEELMDRLTVAEFIDYLKENGSFEDYSYEYLEGDVVKCEAYELKEENSNLSKEFLVTEDGRVFYWRTLLDKIELVDREPEKKEEGTEGMTEEQVKELKVGDRVIDIIDDVLEVVSISEDQIMYELKWVQADGSLSKGSQIYVPSHFKYCRKVETEEQPEEEWEVYLSSSGGCEKHFTSFQSEAEAEDFCREMGWNWIDENEFEWSMDYREV